MIQCKALIRPDSSGRVAGQGLYKCERTDPDIRTLSFVSELLIRIVEFKNKMLSFYKTRFCLSRVLMDKRRKKI